MRLLRPVVVAFCLALVAVAGVAALPSAVAPASASANCSTLPGRLDAHGRASKNYNSQVRNINAQGGGSAAQVAYYNSWRARLVSERSRLSSELRECQRQGKLRNETLPQGPGERNSAPSRRTPPPREDDGPTPGFGTPARYPRGSGVTSDRELRSRERVVIFAYGGSVRYGSLSVVRQHPGFIVANVTRHTLGKGSMQGLVTPHGYGGRYRVKGLLLGASLGGLGGDARNVVPMTPGAAARLAAVERKVAEAARSPRCRGVDYRVFANYGGRTYADSITYSARGCGLNIGGTIPNR